MHTKYLHWAVLAPDDGTGGGMAGDTAGASGDAGSAHQGEGASGNDGDQGVKAIQDEAQKIANAIVAKKLRGMPSKEELAQFKQWQESQKTPEQKGNEALLQAQQQADAYRQKVETYERKDKVLSAGVPAQFAEFVAFTAGNAVTDDVDFDTALAAYIKANPQYKGMIPRGKTQLEHNAAPVATTTNDYMNNLIRGAKGVIQ